jgi:flagellar protein FlaG
MSINAVSGAAPAPLPEPRAGRSGAPGASGAAVPSVVPAPASDAVQAAVEQAQSIVRRDGRSLDFQVDKVTGETVVTVRNTDSGEVVRQIPSEEALRLAQQLAENHNSLIDTKA